MPPVGFQPTIPASARPQTYALDRAVTGIGFCMKYAYKHLSRSSLIRRDLLQMERAKTVVWSGVVYNT
jgi:hypothetical protein